MDQFTEMRSKAFGFTLIEIVMVLVLLGILSAVAVPKYFDLQEEAQAKARSSTSAAYSTRILNGSLKYLRNFVLSKQNGCRFFTDSRFFKSRMTLTDDVSPPSLSLPP